MKKYVFISILLVLSMLICSCGVKTPDNSTSEKDDVSNNETDNSEDPGDNSENEKEPEPQRVNPLANKTPEVDSTVYIYKDLTYGTRNSDIKSGQYFDVYLPKALSELDEDTPVFLFVHGGSWCQRQYDKSNNKSFLKKVAESGYIVISMNYILQQNVLDEPNRTINKNISYESMLADIDALMNYLDTFLPDIGVKATKIGIGGESAGAHLSSYYAYTNKGTSKLKIGYVMDVVGPLDLTDDMFMSLYPQAATLGVSNYIRLYCSLIGIEYTDSINLADYEDILKQYSPYYYIDENTLPTILGYANLGKTLAGIPITVETDGLVPVSTYTNACAALEVAGVNYSSNIFKGYQHGQLLTDTTSTLWLVSQLISYQQYLK